MKSIGVGILGGTGYGAGELLRLLVAHPAVEVVSVTSSSNAGKPISETHTQLEGFYKSLFDKELNFDRLAEYESAVVFASLPHGTSAEAIGRISEQGLNNLKIIDLSGDFRLRSPELHLEFYAQSSRDEALRSSFEYGLTELFREKIGRARNISNPGCLATGCILAAAPLAALNMGSVLFDAKTGTSGAGKTPQPITHHPSQNANFTAYKVLCHRHEPEIRQTLGDIGFGDIDTSFVPHLLPVSRGIFVTAYTFADRDVKTEELIERFEGFYAGSPFVRVRSSVPELRNVVGSNFCDVSVFARGRQIVAMSALDNLVKGMVGQAVQNMNVMLGRPETEGLWHPALGLV